MQLKHTVVALAAAGLLSVQAHAGEMQVKAAIQPAQTVAAFTDADLQALFEASDKPMQLAALSQQEMRETEGARISIRPLLPWVIRGSAMGGIGAAIGASNAYNSGARGWEVVRAAGIGFVGGAAAGITSKWLGSRGW